MTSTNILKIVRISIEIKIKSYPLYSTLLNFLISQNKEYGFDQLHEFWQWTKFIIGKSLANFAKRHLENWTLQQANCVQIHFESFPFLRYEPTKWNGRIFFGPSVQSSYKNAANAQSVWWPRTSKMLFQNLHLSVLSIIP